MKKQKRGMYPRRSTLRSDKQELVGMDLLMDITTRPVRGGVWIADLKGMHERWLARKVEARLNASPNES